MSNKTKCTPGPWIITEGDELSNFIYDNQGEDGLLYPIATIEHGEPETLAANTALIAAAPELLALLESLTFVAETAAHLRGLEREILPTTDKARELIARVKG